MYVTTCFIMQNTKRVEKKEKSLNKMLLLFFQIEYLNGHLFWKMLLTVHVFRELFSMVFREGCGFDCTNS